MSKTEAEINRWKREKGSGLESVEGLIKTLRSDVHPNHFLIFRLKKSSILSCPIDDETSTSDLKIVIRFIVEVLAIIEALDPGVTVHRATFLKVHFIDI